VLVVLAWLGLAVVAWLGWQTRAGVAREVRLAEILVAVAVAVGLVRPV
jgi:hypothetical protein